MDVPQGQTACARTACVDIGSAMESYKPGAVAVGRRPLAFSTPVNATRRIINEACVAVYIIKL